jgi:acyl dehydratase
MVVAHGREGLPMEIDPDRAIGCALPTQRWTWGADDVILYHLGLNIGGAAEDLRGGAAENLRYLYEDDLAVLPSFGVLPALPVAAAFDQVPGMGFDRSGEVHGEHELTVHADLPPAASVTTTGQVSAVHDKAGAAIVVLDTQTRDDADRLLCENRFTAFLRGAGNFGGTPGPRSSQPVPTGQPDHVVRSPTSPTQALLYRLSGDKNPLHADPVAARQAGFPRPILHGLATFGVVLKAVVDAALDGDLGVVGRYRARFAGVVYPGETIVTSIWRSDDGFAVAAVTAERGEPVLSHGLVTRRTKGQANA